MALDVEKAATFANAVGAGAPGSNLFKTTPKGIDDTGDAIRELNKRFQDRFTFDNSRFVDRYIKSEILLMIKFSIRGVNEEFFAKFEGVHSFIWPDEEIVEHRDGFAEGLLKRRCDHRSEIDALKR